MSGKKNTIKSLNENDTNKNGIFNVLIKDYHS